jgi:hypothetical protein
MAKAYTHHPRIFCGFWFRRKSNRVPIFIRVSGADLFLKMFNPGMPILFGGVGYPSKQMGLKILTVKLSVPLLCLGKFLPSR